jgi:hypothetical protein
VGMPCYVYDDGSERALVNFLFAKAEVRGCLWSEYGGVRDV